jgi:signal transduction histidine kinase
MFSTADEANPVQSSRRTCVAIRIFGLSVATGSLLSAPAGRTAVPLLAALVLIVAVTTFTDHVLRSPNMWLMAGEAVLVGILCASIPAPLGLLAYLAVPPIVAGVQHGLVSAVNITILSGFASLFTLSVGPLPPTSERVAAMVSWLAIGMGVGLLAGWQSRTARDRASRLAPYAAAHHLMVRLHQMATSGALGLDSASLASDLDAAMRRATSSARSTIFVVDPDGSLRPLNGGDDVERLASEIEVPESERTPGAAVVPLRGAHQVLGYCVLVGVPRWTYELEDRARAVADDFAVRLDTAVLFDEVRRLATSEERNRIAREMHDGVAQEIVGLGYIVDEIEALSDHRPTLELVSSLRSEITRLVSEIRFSIFDLRHQVIDGRLSSSLADYAREVTHATGLRVHLSLAESGPPLPPRVATEVLRVAQEAINNVRKHAHAANLWITLDSNGSSLSLEVEDDGIGDAGPRHHHWGMQTMRERAETVGAALDVTPRLHGGTVVSLRSPKTTAPETENAHEHHRATG